MLRFLAAAAAARSPPAAAAAAALRRFLHGGGREEAESVAYRMSMLRAPPVLRKAGLPTNSCSFIGRLGAPVRPFDDSFGEFPKAYTFLNVSSSSPRSSRTSNFCVTLHLEGKLANVSLKHLKQNDLVYVSGFLGLYHRVDASGVRNILYKIYVTDLNYVLDQNQRPQNGENSSDKAKMMSTNHEILQEKKYIDRLHLWQVFFASPYEWWDNRQSKPHFSWSDFKHKDTGEKLWLYPDDPPWIRRQLELLDLEMAENGRRDDSRTRKNNVWKSQDFVHSDDGPQDSDYSDDGSQDSDYSDDGSQDSDYSDDGSQDSDYSDDDQVLHSSGV